MDKAISLSKAFITLCLSIIVFLCYHLGIDEAIEVCITTALYSIYYVLSVSCVALIVLSICASTSSASADVKYHREYNDVWGKQWLDSTIVSFMGAVFAIVVGGISAMYASYAGLDTPSSEMLSFETLLFVFWKPYLWSHAISLVFGCVHYLDRKYRVVHRLTRKAKLVVKKVFRW